MSSARNAGLDICKGEYITFVDSDDYVSSEIVRFLYDLLVEFKADMSFCEAHIIYTNGRLSKAEKELKKNAICKEKFFEKMLYNKYSVSAIARLYKKRLFDGLRFTNGRLFEDSDIIYRLINRTNKIAVSNAQFYYYRLRSDSITNSKFNYRKLDLITVSEEMCEYILTRYPQLEKAAASKMVWALLSTLNQLYKSDDIDKETEKMILDKMKKHEKNVFFDRQAPITNKLGILSRNIGREFYIWAWNLYYSLTKA